MTTLVLLPGMDGTGTLCRDFVAALAPSNDSIVISYPADRALGYTELEAIVRSKLPIGRPYVLLGESFSGPIAISIAASRPPGLIGVILCCSFACNPHPILGPFRRLLALVPFKLIPSPILSFFVLGTFATAPLQADLRAVLSELPNATLRARTAAVLAVDVLSLLPDIPVPVLYLRGAQDRIVPCSCSDSIARGVRQSKIVEISAPHFLLQAAPDEAANAVKEFMGALASHSNSPPR
jgi:pimeloyl-[acyl-carrier protein] methyl ester esterase